MERVPDEFRIESRPSGVDTGFGWSIVRTPSDTGLGLVIVSDDIFGVRTHYFLNRTMPCMRRGCPACAAGRLSRWSGYLLAVRIGGGEKVVFEFTPAAVPTFDAEYGERKTLRGLHIIATRASKRENAKVMVAVKGLHANAHKLPPSQDVWPILSHIWGINRQKEIFDGGTSEYDDIRGSSVDNPLEHSLNDKAHGVIDGQKDFTAEAASEFMHVAQTLAGNLAAPNGH